jgi:hypothetical protein
MSRAAVHAVYPCSRFGKVFLRNVTVRDHDCPAARRK